MWTSLSSLLLSEIISVSDCITMEFTYRESIRKVTRRFYRLGRVWRELVRGEFTGRKALDFFLGSFI